MIILRPYATEDLPELIRLFRNTVHSVCAADYTREQLNVWAPQTVDTAEWNARSLRTHTLIAEQENTIVGFSNMDETGYLDMLYVHCHFLRQGIARRLVAALEQAVPSSQYTAYVSETALPFCQRAGYVLVRENSVTRNGVSLRNYEMKKYIV